MLVFHLIMLIRVISTAANAQDRGGKAGNALPECEAGQAGSHRRSRLDRLSMDSGSRHLGGRWLITEPGKRGRPACGHSARKAV